MASGTINFTSSSEKVEGRIVWSSTANVAANTSTVSVTVQVRKTVSIATTGTWEGHIAAMEHWKTREDEDALYKTFSQYKALSNSWFTLGSYSFTAVHDTDGTCSLQIGASIRPPSGTSLAGKNLYATEIIDLDTIYRKATLTAAPNFNDEGNPTITYSNPLGNNATSLQACIASADGVTIHVPYRDISKTGTSYTFSLTDAERKTLRKAVTSGSTLQVKFYVKTVNGGNNYYSSLERTLTLVNHTPTLSPVVEDVNEMTIALTGDKNKIIRYYSYVSYTINAAARKEATLTSQKVTNGTQVMTAASGVIYSAESNSFVFNATDSRGNTVSKTITKTLIPYYKLSCGLEANASSTDGLVSYTIKGSYYNGSFGVVNNTLAFQYRYKKSNGSYGSWITITNATVQFNDTHHTYSATGSFTIPDFDYKSTYTIQTKAMDKLAAIESNEYSIKLYPIFDWGDNDFNFNVPVKFSEGITDGDNVYNLAGLAKAMSNAYELNTTITAGANYSSATGSNAVLIGNNLRCYINANRSSASGVGNVANEPVATFKIVHNGKIKAAYVNSFSNGSTGNVATFIITDATNDGTTLTFTVDLAATAAAVTQLAAYFIVPVVIDYNAY